jgi:hypothetical protein
VYITEGATREATREVRFRYGSDVDTPRGRRWSDGVPSSYGGGTAFHSEGNGSAHRASRIEGHSDEEEDSRRGDHRNERDEMNLKTV